MTLKAQRTQLENECKRDLYICARNLSNDFVAEFLDTAA